MNAETTSDLVNKKDFLLAVKLHHNLSLGIQSIKGFGHLYVWPTRKVKSIHKDLQTQEDQSAMCILFACSVRGCVVSNGIPTLQQIIPSDIWSAIIPSDIWSAYHDTCHKVPSDIWSAYHDTCRKVPSYQQTHEASIMMLYHNQIPRYP